MGGWVDTSGVRVGATARPPPPAGSKKSSRTNFWPGFFHANHRPLRTWGPRGPRGPKNPTDFWLRVFPCKSTAPEDLGPQGPQNWISGQGVSMQIIGPKGALGGTQGPPWGPPRVPLGAPRGPKGPLGPPRGPWGPKSEAMGAAQKKEPHTHTHTHTHRKLHFL